MKNALVAILLISILSNCDRSDERPFCEARFGLSAELERIYKEFPEGPRDSVGFTYTVRVFFHFIRYESGSGGQNVIVMDTIMKNLARVFNSHNIYFDNIGHDEVKSNDFMSFNSTMFTRLAATKTVSTAINIYLLPDDKYNNGDGEGITIVLGGARPVGYRKTELLVPSLAIAHEMGHCLGLLHTYDRKKIELVDGSNCKDYGDWVCDTRADHESFEVQANCRWKNPVLDVDNQHYENTDPTNIMTTIRIPSCYQHLEPGQGDRMRTALRHASVLAPVWY